MGLLVNTDAARFRGYFKEMAKLLGIEVEYQYPIDMDYSTYGDENPLGFSEPTPMDIIFEENPKISTLKKLGWWVEGEDRQPYTAELPYDAPNLAKGCRILIPSGLRDQSRVFVITDIKANLQFADSWICKLAPVFHNKNTEKQVTVDTKKHNNSFIKLD
jgi:hypothetical protein